MRRYVARLSSKPKPYKTMEQEIYGDKGYDENPDKPCKIEGCVNFDYEDGMCETHLDEINSHDCTKGGEDSCDCEKYDERQ